MAETIYVPNSSVKERNTSFGSCFKVSFKAETLGEFVRKHKNEKGYINLEIVPRKEESEYGDTHSIKLDTWKPDPNRAKGNGGGGKPAAKSGGKGKATPKDDPLDADGGDAAPDDIPF